MTMGAVAAKLVIHCLGRYLKRCTASQFPMYFLSKQPNDFRQFYQETNPRDLFQYKDSRITGTVNLMLTVCQKDGRQLKCLRNYILQTVFTVIG